MGQWIPAEYRLRKTDGTQINDVYSCAGHLAETRSRVKPSDVTKLDPPFRYGCKGCLDDWPE